MINHSYDGRNGAVLTSITASFYWLYCVEVAECSRWERYCRWKQVTVMRMVDHAAPKFLDCLLIKLAEG